MIDSKFGDFILQGQVSIENRFTGIDHDEYLVDEERRLLLLRRRLSRPTEISKDRIGHV